MSDVIPKTQPPLPPAHKRSRDCFLDQPGRPEVPNKTFDAFRSGDDSNNDGLASSGKDHKVFPTVPSPCSSREAYLLLEVAKADQLQSHDVAEGTKRYTHHRPVHWACSAHNLVKRSYSCIQVCHARGPFTFGWYICLSQNRTDCVPAILLEPQLNVNLCINEISSSNYPSPARPHGLEEMKSYMVNTKNAVESATAGIRSGFQLSADQAMQVLLVSKDMIVQAGQMKYKALHVNVELWIPKSIKKECSAVQNKFHMLILDSTSGEGKVRLMLEELTWTALSKYKQGGVGSGSKAEHQLHLAYLHYYGQQLKKAALRVVKKGQPWKSASNKAPPGRVKTGHNFWSAIDRLFVKDLEWYGRDMKNDKWCDFFNEIIIQDQERYRTNLGSMLPLLPSMYTELPLATASPNPGTLSTVIYHGMSHMSQPLARQFFSSDMIPQATCSGSNCLPTSDSLEDLWSPNF
ncbi:hypothetical protein EDD17DRAFT_1508797 [Pisolithus thermaeus]|nr:hypothetical protein EDD17DRAFT_1508797 [Pisolithus thermaeus]